MTWILVVISLVGVVLNAKRRRSCFMLWAFTNTAWCVYDFRIGAYAQSALFGVYVILAVWGWFEWGKASTIKL